MGDKDMMYYSPLFEKIYEFLSAGHGKTIFLFVPYIKVNVLEKLLEGIDERIVVITTWEPRDLLYGSSDLTLYPFCREHKIALYVSKNLHLKVYSVGLESAILATGNISGRGLLPDGNYEAGTLIENLTSNDRLFLNKIRSEARLVDDAMYEELKEWYEQNKIEPPDVPHLSDIVSEPIVDDFSIASLPMTRSVDDLISGYMNISRGLEPSEDEEIKACIFHDLANYKMEPGLSELEFRRELASEFFAHPFIQRIDEFITQGAQFGSIKAWIQNNCTDVPIPSRRELTGNVQVLLEWFVSLGNGKYVVDVPGSHSQRLRKIHD